MKEARFFYVPCAETSTELPADEAVHAVRVLRLQSGDAIFLIDGAGNFFQAEVTMTTNKRCVYEIKEKMPQQKGWHGSIHLAIAPTKMMERMEWMVEKSTEIGVDGFTFLDCKFSERHNVRIDRIEKIAVSAMKQSRKAWLPRVSGMESFSGFISAERSGRKFIAHCYEEIERRDFLTEISLMPQQEDITVLVGPEGDFSIDEVRQAIDAGYEPVSLGNSRLRTETAGLMAVAMSQMVKRVKPQMV